MAKRVERCDTIRLNLLKELGKSFIAFLLQV